LVGAKLVAAKEKIWRFQYTVASQDAKLAPVKVQIDFYKMPKESLNRMCVEFMNLGGNASAFAKHFAKTFGGVL
jgi:hypothetical protein